MIKILSAPYYTLFSRQFYRDVAASPVSKAFQYLAYLSGLATIVILLFFVTSVAPQIGGFFDWFRQSMPAVTITKDGATTDVKVPYTVRHPEFGPLVLIDTSKPEGTAEEMGSAFLYITNKKLYVREDFQNPPRIYDVAELAAQQGGESFVFDAQAIQAIKNFLMPLLMTLAFFLTFPIFFVTHLLSSLFYSLVGLGINAFRQPKLPYSSIFTLSVFALTPAAMWQWLCLFLPPVFRNPWLGLLGIFLSCYYLFVAVKKTEGDEFQRIVGGNFS